jgi:hypothetical protein
MKVYRNLIYKDGYLLDPFIEEETWIYRRNITKYFQDKYNLNPQQLWNTVNGNPLNYIPKCPICGNPVNFNKLSRGFNETCSASCHTKLQIKLGVLDDNIDALNSVDSQARGRFTQFMQSGDSTDKCVFYIATAIGVPNMYKFGITSDIYYRGHYFGVDFNWYEILLEGTRLEVATLERDLKIKLNQISEWIKKDSLNEFMKKFNYIKNKINMR